MKRCLSIFLIVLFAFLFLKTVPAFAQTPGLWNFLRDSNDGGKLKLWYNSIADNFFTITNTGKIGIGTATPAYTLQVVGSGFNAGKFAVNSNSTNVTSAYGAPLILQNTSATAGNYSAIGFVDGNGNLQGSMGMIYGAHSGMFQGGFYIEPRQVGTPTTFVITPTGKIGIGTATPAYILDVNGATRTLGSDVFAQSNNTSTSYNDAPIQIREAQYGASISYLPPRLSFHWGGVVASQIAIEQDGTIAIRNNPGTAYEKFKSSMITDTGSKVGIGTRNPTAPLTVAGGNIDIEANRTIYSPGRMHVFGEEILYLLNKSGVVVSKSWGGNGNLSVEGTKNFEIPHPLDPEKRLVHSSLEGPEAAVFYRGEGQLLKGEAEVILPNYFEALTRPDNRTVTLTAKGKTPYLLSTEDIKNGKFKVYGTQPYGKFFWEVKAVRKDVPPLQVEKPKT